MSRRIGWQEGPWFLGGRQRHQGQDAHVEEGPEKVQEATWWSGEEEDDKLKGRLKTVASRWDSELVVFDPSLWDVRYVVIEDKFLILMLSRV